MRGSVWGFNFFLVGFECFNIRVFGIEILVFFFCLMYVVVDVWGVCGRFFLLFRD